MASSPLLSFSLHDPFAPRIELIADTLYNGPASKYPRIRNIDRSEEAIYCDNLVTILAGNRPILMYIGALTSGCNSLKMLVDVAKCELALDVPTGLRNKWWKTEIDVSRCSSSSKPLTVTSLRPDGS